MEQQIVNQNSKIHIVYCKQKTETRTKPNQTKQYNNETTKTNNKTTKQYKNETTTKLI